MPPPPACVTPRVVPADVVLAAFSNLSSAELRDFVDVYFDKPGTELEPWTPLDWQEK